MTETAATNAIQIFLPGRLAYSAFSRRMERAVPLKSFLGCIHEAKRNLDFVQFRRKNRRPERAWINRNGELKASSGHEQTWNN